MREVPAELAARIESRAARLCTAWIVTRRDGARLGFTDHDRDLTVQGVACAAASGWTAGTVEAELGYSPGTAAAAGALDSAALTEADIARGLYDAAAIEAWRVEWSEPELCVLLWAGAISRLVRQGLGFTAEIEGPLAALDQVVGRTYGRLCDAQLGDGRCRADVSGGAFNGAGVVVAVEDNRRLTVSGPEAFAPAWFLWGQVTFTSGANAGATALAAAHDIGAGGVVLTLLERPLALVAPGDGFTVRAGCDKQFETCAAKFSNTLNFQGFPHIPGDDFLMAYPRAGDQNDGSARR